MILFPAVMIGGPPHSGKSVLAYSLTQALRARGLAHYVLRAYPDGEGDWANEADQALVRRIRFKGQGTPQWVSRMCRDIAGRHLPLIVDVGGRPTAWQETIFDHCTQAILLTPDEVAGEGWRNLAKKHALPVIAELRSTLHGDDFVTATRPILTGQLSQLERGHTARGPAFAALVDLLADLFAYDEAELRTAHLALAPVELVIDLSRMGQTLGLGGAWQRWSPHHLPALLDYLPPNTPLAIYDRGPNWLYAALSLYAYPAPFYQFDVRLGWVAPPPLTIAPDASSPQLTVQFLERDTHLRLEFSLSESYLDYSEAETLTLPPLPPGRPAVLSGKLPLWLWTALVRAYRAAPWLGVFQPPLGDQAVVVTSREGQPQIGSLVTSESS